MVRKNTKSSSRPVRDPGASIKSTSAILNELKNVTLGSDQESAFEKLEHTRHNYFVTGKAGTGKSVLLSYFTTHTAKKIAVLSPTGVAALNVAGQTIHSFFQLELGIQDCQNVEKVTDLKDKQAKIMRGLDALVIDEISMVSADVMDMIDAKLRFARGVNAPFGGVQMIVFGDLFQLPPVAPKGDGLTFLLNRYQSIYFFDSHVVGESPFEIIELNQVYRQTDPIFIEILNRIRRGEVDWSLIRDINANCAIEPPDDDFVTLASVNATADSINSMRLAALAAPEYHYDARLTGEMTSREFPAAEVLKLREGAHVMMIKNDRLDPDAHKTKQRWVNGTLGVVSRLTDDSVWVRVGKKQYEVDLEEWEKFRYYYDAKTGLFDKESIATFTQYPIKLAYAITIHKSQGQTYDAVRVDMGRGAFATGQTYVALSRCRSLEKLYLAHPLRLSDIRVDRRVVEWMEG